MSPHIKFIDLTRPVRGAWRLVNDRIVMAGRADTTDNEHTLRRTSEFLPYFKVGLARQFLETPLRSSPPYLLLFLLFA